jgi:peptidase M28-like protein
VPRRAPSIAAWAAAISRAWKTLEWVMLRFRWFQRRDLVLSILFASLVLSLWAAVAQPVLPRRPMAAPAADIVRLESHVRMLCEQLPPRDPKEAANLDRAAVYIRGQLVAARARVADQPFSVAGSEYRNVVGSYGPEAAERIVVGAHYDAAAGLPGADDNASGVAALLELAYLLGQHPPALRVDLVAYSLEEPPHFRTPRMGSAVHVAALRGQDVPVRAMLCLEGVGFYSAAPGSQRYPIALLRLSYPSRGDFIAVVGRLADGWLVRRVKSAMRAASPLPVYSINAPAFLQGVDFSDHLNYWAAGIPAVMITDTAFYRNHNYHTADDRPETLDFNRMQRVVQGVFQAVRELAD